MNDTMDIIEIRQALQDGECNVANDIYIDWANLLVDTVERAFVHEFHADADMHLVQG